MFNTIFTTLFEAQITNQTWLHILRGLDLVVWIYAAERFLDFVIRVWSNYRVKKEEKKRMPIGFK